MPTPTLLQRLKERKLVQWALAYLAGAWVVYEGSGTAVETWNMPVLLVRSIHVLLIIGFFITLILAWYHGEKGRQRVSGPELLMVTTLLVVAGVTLTLLRPKEDRFFPVALEGDDRPGIGVFPCENWSPDPDDAYFASGIHDEILLRLTSISGLRSVGRETMEWYNERSIPPRQVAQELGVGYLGECSVRKDREGNQVRLTFQLIDGETGTQLLARSYDETLSARSIFDIQSEVARQVAQAVGAAMTPEEEIRIASMPTESTEAYQLYLQGEFWLRDRTKEVYQRATEFLSRAVELDSTFALGYAGLAKAYVIAGWYGFLPSRTEARDRALAAANRSLELDEDLAQAHSVLGSIARLFDWNWTRAEPHYVRGVELAPADPEVLRAYGTALLNVGELAHSEQLLRQAVASDPLSAMANYNLGDLLSTMGRASEAVTLLQRTLEMYPGHQWTVEALQRALYLVGRYGDAIELDPSSAIAAFSLVALGRGSEVQELVATVEAEGIRNSKLLFTATGDYDRAFEILAEEVEERLPSLWWVSVDPLFEPLHYDPRWTDFLRVLRAKG